MKQLTCGSINGMRIRQSLPPPHVPQTGTQVSWRCSSWEPEFRDGGAIPGRRAAVDCGEIDGGDVRQEIVVGNACGGKPGSHGSKEILLSHAQGVGPPP